ncbi:hypothetical protein [Streptomyces sp. NRRL B-24484]|uniref:hypothetical protein n=1 Tax=Streptomyces sp. NRRL B-24484 TaxID=1463833 RepID=UPI0004C0B939|nr:hypothetical protein [Streptomyces sp. NRRL B-24484]
MTDLARLRVLFDELGDYQRSLDDGAPLAETKPAMLGRLAEAHLLLPPGNEHLWSGFRWWIMHTWAAAQQEGGDSASEPWREFLAEVNDVLGPAPDAA